MGLTTARYELKKATETKGMELGSRRSDYDVNPPNSAIEIAVDVLMLTSVGLCGWLLIMWQLLHCD